MHQPRESAQVLTARTSDEIAVCGSIFGWPERLEEVNVLVTPEHFVDEQCRSFFRVAQKLDAKGIRFDDKAALLNELEGKPGFHNKDAIVSFVSEIRDLLPTGANAEYYAKQVAKQYRARRIQDIFRDGLEFSQENPAEAVADAHNALTELMRGGDLPQNDFRPIPIDELSDAHPTLPEPIIDGLLRRGETANIIAASKVGKSWLVYGLALSVAMGWDWLGSYRCERGRVLIIDNELMKSNLTSRIATVANAMELDRSQYRVSLDIIALRGRLLDLNQIIAKLMSFEPGTYDVVIFDAFYRGLPAGVSENDNGQIAALYNAIDAAAAHLNCCWINIHHASKGSQSDKAVTDIGAGAGSQSRAADAHIVLRPHEEDGVVVLDAAVRSFAPIDPQALRWRFPLWEPAAGIDTEKLKGRGTRTEERQSKNDRDAFDKILECLGLEAASKSTLTKKTGISSDRLKRLLPMLESKGEITSEETTVSNNTCLVYAISDQPKSWVYD